MLTVRQISQHVVEVSRDGGPKACLIDPAVYAGCVEGGRNEAAIWRLVESRCLATRRKKEA